MFSWVSSGEVLLSRLYETYFHANPYVFHNLINNCHAELWMISLKIVDKSSNIGNVAEFDLPDLRE